MPRADDLSTVGAPPAVTARTEPPPAAAAPMAQPARQTPAKPRKAKRLTWEQRHVHKKLWFDREQLAQVQARLEDEDDGRTVAALVKELFDEWLATPSE